MRSKTTVWFETKVRYNKLAEDGTQKKTTERYVIDALSFTEAEESIAKEMASYINGEYEVKGIVPAAYSEVVFSDKDNEDKFYKVKIYFISFNEKTGKEKRIKHAMLVQGGSLSSAVDNVVTIMQGTVSDYVLASVAETSILDVFEHEDNE